MPVFICQDLYFNMPGLLNIFFNIDIGISETRLCSCLGGNQAAHQPDIMMVNPHSFSAAACCCLYNYGITYPSGGLNCLLFIFHNLSRSEEHTSELQSQFHLVCRLLLEN